LGVLVRFENFYGFLEGDGGKATDARFWAVGFASFCRVGEARWGGVGGETEDRPYRGTPVEAPVYGRKLGT